MNDAVSSLDVELAPAQLGRELAAARASCGLSIADVARQIKLAPAQVEALEAGRFERLPGTVFVRGFIRNYARLVKLDPEALLAGAGCPRLHTASQEPDLRHSVNIPFQTGRKFKWRRYAIAALVALLLLLPVVLSEIYRDDANEVIVKSRSLELPQPQAAVPAQTAEAGAVPPAGAPAELALVPALTPDTITPLEKAAVEKPEPPARPVGNKRGEYRITLAFERQSWVEIKDRSGRTIFTRLNAAGTEQTVSGEPPLALVIGNADGVRLTHDGEAVDLAPHINANVARLTIE